MIDFVETVARQRKSETSSRQVGDRRAARIFGSISPARSVSNKVLATSVPNPLLQWPSGGGIPPGVQAATSNSPMTRLCGRRWRGGGRFKLIDFGLDQIDQPTGFRFGEVLSESEGDGPMLEADGLPIPASGLGLISKLPDQSDLEFVGRPHTHSKAENSVIYP